MSHSLQWPVAFLFLLSATGQEKAAEPTDHFESKIRPLLVQHCLKCHGAEKQKGGLRLDSKAGWETGGEHGPALKPGKPDESLLLKAIRGADGVEPMPPAGKLSAAEIAAFEQWVKEGAIDPRGGPARLGGMTLAEAKKWWSFQPLRRPEVPTTKAKIANPIDAFIIVKLEAKGLSLSAPADRRTLIRRATYDLTGLPPTPEEVEAFIQDASPDAYEKLVDRLLASPAYGERWGRHWLDLVRYADTAGENSDHPLPHAWRYRNWVIEAFNRDMPYDEFLREQLAGDILADGGPNGQYAPHVIATGFLAIARRFGHEIDKDMYLTHEDTIDTVGKAFLGLTLGCARCHDHKYDAISTQDYYALYGIFDSTKYAFPGCEPQQRPRDLVPLVPRAEWERSTKPYRDRLADANARVKQLRKEEARRARAIQPTLAKTATLFAVGQIPDHAELGTKLLALSAAAKERSTAERELAAIITAAPRPEVAFAVTEGKPHDVPVQLRGDPAKPGLVVPRRWLELFGGEPLPAKAGSGRLELAGWISAKNNPLTGRVMVNRIWLQHFGTGLVKTPNDFGARGAAPTHTELLDWLAIEFQAPGNSAWSIKRMHKLIMLSATYQQASAFRLEAASIDANNDLCWRFERRRLSGEEIRDALLATSGQLDRKPGGPHPFPPESSWNFTQHVPFSTFYESDKRSVYLIVVRNRRQPFLGLFDGADPNATTPQRQTTTVPPQALYFLNDPFFHAQAEKVAARVLTKVEDAARLDELFRLVLQRAPTLKEREVSIAFLQRYTAALTNTPPAERTKAAWAALARVTLASNEFLYLD